MRQMFDVKPEVIFKRDGNSLKEKTIIAPGEEFDAVFRLNETLEWKEGDHFHVKVSFGYVFCVKWRGLCKCSLSVITVKL